MHFHTFKLFAISAPNKGFDEPAVGIWSNNICKIDKAEMIKGIQKCKPKDLVIVGYPKTKPAHIHWAKGSPR